MFKSWSTNWKDSQCSIHIVQTCPVLRLGTLHLKASRLLYSQLKHMNKTRSSSWRLSYVNGKWIHVKLKQSQSVSLNNVYNVENKTDPKQKGKTTKVDKVLFQRLLVAKDAGREIVLKKLLCHELSPVPLAIADTAGNLRPTKQGCTWKAPRRRCER